MKNVTKKTKKIPYLLVLLLLSCLPTLAQNGVTVKGTVLDGTGETVIGASIVVKGNTSIGTISDIDGNFTLAVPSDNVTLVVSFIGMKSQEVKATVQKPIKVILEDDSQQLEEVVVVGFGQQKKASVVGAIAQTNSKTLERTGGVTSLGQALTGNLPGVVTMTDTGKPGDEDPKITIRGVTSWNSSDPLVLVDGVERPMASVDINSVASISVLKDASATAVFGVRGANGVILVTTKRGQSGKAKITFSTSAGLQMPTNIPEFANSYDYAMTYNAAQLRDGVAEDKLMFTDAMLEGFRTHSNPILYADTDWTDLLIKNSALQTQHNMTISGGSDRVRYFASLGVFTQKGLFETFHENDRGFSYNRYNYRINMDIDVTKTTSMKINLGGRLTDKTEPNYNNGTYTDISYLYDNIYSAVPFSGAGIVDGKWISVNKSVFGNFGVINDGLNTYYGKGYTTTGGNVINFDFSLEQKLDVLTKGLKAHIKGAYNSGVTDKRRREGKADQYEAYLTESGETLIRKIQEAQTMGWTQEAGILKQL